MVKSVKHAPLGGLDVELFDFALVEILALFGYLDGEGARITLVRNRQASFAVKGHRYPGTVFFLVDFIDEIDLETRGHVQARGFVLHGLLHGRNRVFAGQTRERKQHCENKGSGNGHRGIFRLFFVRSKLVEVSEESNGRRVFMMPI